MEFEKIFLLKKLNILEKFYSFNDPVIQIYKYNTHNFVCLKSSFEDLQSILMISH